MGMKKRPRSSSTAQGAPASARNGTAGTAGAISRGSRGSSLPCTPPDRPDSRPGGPAQPEAMGDLNADPREGSPLCSPRGRGKPKNESLKTTAPKTAGQAEADPTGTRASGTSTKLGTVRFPTSVGHVAGSSVTPLDHVLVFGHGKFQWVILLCTQLAVFCTVVHAVTLPSLARPVDHWCSPPPAYASLPPDLWKNTSIPVEKDGSYSRCFRYEPPFSAHDRDANLSLAVVPCDSGWDYAASLHSSIVAEWDLVCNRSWMMIAMTASYMGGTVVVMPFTGIAADRIGRAPVLVGALFVLVTAGTLLVFSTTLFMFTTLRVFIAASSGTLLVVSLVLLFEVTDSSRRVLYSSVAIAGGVSAANVYTELMYNLVDEWALVQIINMLPGVLLVGAVYFVQESPNWLLAVHLIGRLCKVVEAAARTNGADLERVAKRLEKLHEEDRRSRKDGCDTEGANRTSPLEVVTNPSLRSETLVGFGCWFLAMILFDYLRGSREDRPVYYTQIALECPTVTANVFLLQRKGRRITTAVSMIALGFLVAALGAFSLFFPDPSDADELARHLETAVRVVALLAVDTVTVSLSVITIEMYPTVLRGSGLSFAYVCGRLGAVTMTFASSSSRRGRAVELAVVSLLLVVFGALVLVAMPETTKIHATNMPRNVEWRNKEEDKWKLNEPLRVARDRRASSVANLRRKGSGAQLKSARQ
ncbi:solute carrier family 22 member 7 [Rhipicephalus sanguineus]|uniref:solute carrier family 22 member 7 n=1 Tax=Rhipicephalus sanguineus TaxID=34632 RepID=UPI001893CA5B|nr:solute carrier family 22 member 7 [Rhipicephalus sanguineus]